MPLVEPIELPLGHYDPFPPIAGEGIFPSSGDVDLWWRLPDTESVFDTASRRRETFHFFGKDMSTTVWRSAPLTSGSQSDTHGVPIGPSSSTLVMGARDILRRPQLPIDARLGEGRRRKIYVELHSLNMRGEGITLLAGEPFLQHLQDELKMSPVQISRVFRRSYGEVISWDVSGNPKRDFPADNHFNVFFALRFDATDSCPAFTLYNKEPVVVVDLGLTSLPPLGRVTIPQFPYDMPTLSLLTSGAAGQKSESLVDLGHFEAAGGCCAHAVRGLSDLPFRAINFSELSQIVPEDRGAGYSLRTGRWAGGDLRLKDATQNRSMFHAMVHPYIDGVFVPNGHTQVTSTGLVFKFEDTSAGAVSDAVRHGVSSVDVNGKTFPIHVDAPPYSTAYQPPQSVGVGLGPNGGFTINIAALREKNPDFYLVNLIALMGMSAESPRGSRVVLRVLVDGVEVPFTGKEYSVPGSSDAISVDLQTAQRFVTLASTSTSGEGNGVFALFQLRGFGSLADDKLLPYRGPSRPNAELLRQLGVV